MSIDITKWNFIANPKKQNIVTTVYIIRYKSIPSMNHTSWASKDVHEMVISIIFFTKNSDQMKNELDIRTEIQKCIFYTQGT